MKKEIIFKKAIEKAIRNGWKPLLKWKIKENPSDIKVKEYYTKKYIIYFEVSKGKNASTGHYLYGRDIIFDHDFIKAFWDKKKTKKCECGNIINVGSYVCECCGMETDEVGALSSGSHFLSFRSEIRPIESWKYHLRAMVLEKEPLLYLKKFLKNK